MKRVVGEKEKTWWHAVDVGGSTQKETKSLGGSRNGR